MKGGSVCIVGTDTGVGKTIVTRLLYHYFLQNDISAITQKWVQCGDLSHTDLDHHDRWVDQPSGPVPHHTERQVYAFPLAVSPHLASKSADCSIDPSHISHSFQVLRDSYDRVIVEGSGGILVPINTQTTLLDIIQTHHIPVVVVVANKLGCINHALLTAEVLKNRGIHCLGFIFNRLSDMIDPMMAHDNPIIISRLSGLPTLGVLPFTTDKDTLIRAFQPIGRSLL